LHRRSPYFSIPADNGNAKINRSRRDDAVGHIRDLASWDLPHSVNNFRVERGFFDHILVIGKCLFSSS
jgi:hypothetical protein